MDSRNTTPDRLAVGVSLFLALAFIVAVITGARIMTDRTTYTPATLSPIDAPAASSPACTNLINNVPDTLDNFRHVEITDPAPEGALAFKNSSGAELTLRCGVHVPDQYTVLSETRKIEGVAWLTIKDATPGSTLQTFYQVGGSPTVAVTTDAPIGKALEALSDSMSVHLDTTKAPQPGSFPLSDTTLEGDGHPALCTEFLADLPTTIGEFKRRDVSAIKGNPSQSATWIAPGQEPLVVRCGVEVPNTYKPGDVLSQVDDVPWYEQPALAQGSTSGRWFALGREAVVAVYMPGEQGNQIITDITAVIEKKLPAESSSSDDAGDSTADAGGDERGDSA